MLFVQDDLFPNYNSVDDNPIYWNEKVGCFQSYQNDNCFELKRCIDDSVLKIILIGNPNEIIDDDKKIYTYGSVSIAFTIYNVEEYIQYNNMY